MKADFRWFCSTFLLFPFLIGGSCLSSKEYAVHDLQSYSQRFDQEASEWTITPNKTNNSSLLCGKTPILGVFAPQSTLIQFSRSYFKLPRHQTIFLTMNLWLCGEISLDFVEVSLLNSNNWSEGQSLARIENLASPQLDTFNHQKNQTKPIAIMVQTSHIEETLILNVEVFGSGLGFFGIRDVSLFLSSRILEESPFCTVSSLLEFESTCQEGCVTGEYQDSSSNLCLPCEESCLQCSGPSSKDCLSCWEGHYLTDQGACENSLLPLKQNNEKVIRRLATCTTSQYKFPDDSCRTECPYPMVSTTSDGEKLCNSPCETETDFYYPQEFSCRSTCLSPYTAQDTTFYDICSYENEKNGVDGLILAIDIMNRIGLMIMSFVTIGRTELIFIIATAKMIQYSKFLELGFSINLLNRLLAQDVNIISLVFGPNGGDSLKSKFSHENIPIGLARMRTISSFLYNYWPYLISLIIFSGLYAIVFLFKFLVKRKQITFLKSETIELIDLHMRNFVVTFLYSSYVDIFFFCFVDFIYTKVRSASDGFSFCFALIFFVLGLVLTAKHGLLLRKTYLVKRKPGESSNDELKKIYDDNKHWQIFFKGIKDINLVKQSYLFMYMVRIMFFGLLNASLCKNPLTASLLINALNLLMLAYLALRRPLNDIFAESMQIICEILLLCLNMSTLSFAGLDNNQDAAEDTREGLGRFVIAVKCIFNFTILTYLIFLSVQAYRQYQQRKYGPPVEQMPQSQNNSNQPKSPENEDNNPDVEVLDQPNDQNAHENNFSGLYMNPAERSVIEEHNTFLNPHTPQPLASSHSDLSFRNLEQSSIDMSPIKPNVSILQSPETKSYVQSPSSTELYQPKPQENLEFIKPVPVPNYQKSPEYLATTFAELLYQKPKTASGLSKALTRGKEEQVAPIQTESLLMRKLRQRKGKAWENNQPPNGLSHLAQRGEMNLMQSQFPMTQNDPSRYPSSFNDPYQ